MNINLLRRLVRHVDDDLRLNQKQKTNFSTQKQQKKTE